MVTADYTDTANPANFSARSGPLPGGQHVHYASAGTCYGELGHQILQPINVDGTSVFKLGSTVPTKFRVCDANGNPVGPTIAAPNVVASFSLVTMMNGVVTAVDEDVYSTTPETAFRWSSTDQLWIFNLSTGKSNATLSQANITYRFQIKLIDGTIIGTLPSGQPGHQFGLK